MNRTEQLMAVIGLTMLVVTLILASNRAMVLGLLR